MPSRKRGGNPEEAGIPPRLKKDVYLPETALCVSGRYPKKADKGGEDGCSFSPRGTAPQEREGQHIAILPVATRVQTPQKDGEWQIVQKKTKKRKEKKEVPVPSTQVLKAKGKLPRLCPTAGSSDAIRVSTMDGESYADILKAMKAKVNLQNLVAEVLSIRRTRREEILLVLKKGGDVSVFEKALDQAVGAKANVKSLVSKRTFEVRDLDETVTREEVVAALCTALVRQTSGTSAGCTSASAVCRLRWSV